MNDEELKALSSKEAMARLSERLKQVLHPTITNDQYLGYGIKLITDIDGYDPDEIISFSVRCLTDEESSIDCIGYVYGDPVSYCVTNLGSDRITEIGAFVENEKLILILIPEYDVLKTEAEIFVSENNKNHVTSIEYLTEEEYDSYVLTEVSGGELDNNFQYTIRTGEEDIVLLPGTYRLDPIDTILHSEDAQELTHDIPLAIEGFDENNNRVLYGSGTLDTRADAQNTIQVTLDTEQLAQSVLEEVSENFPVADENTIGGISLIDQSLLSNNQYPVELTEEEHGAYVDLTNYTPSISTDIHRFIVVPENNVTAGTNLFQYIGRNTEDYITGYYYLWAPTEFQISIEDPLTRAWNRVVGKSPETLIASYNRDHDYILDTNQVLEIDFTEYPTTRYIINDNTEFTVSQGTRFSEVLTLAEIKDKLGYEISTSYILFDYQNVLLYWLQIHLTPEENAWKQKNVLPAIKVGAPLTFKGTATWLELQQYAPTADIGDFYIVSDRANQEYYWTGLDWEFMGDIFDPYEAGDGINITVNHEISVKYDNDTIKKNGSGNLYVDGKLTDTQANWNESDTTSAAYINNKPNLATVATTGSYTDLSNTPTIPAAQIQSDWNQTDNTQLDYIKNKPTIPSAQVNADWNSSSGVSEILHKPTLSTVATTGSYSDLSGTPSLATVATSGSYSDLTNKPSIPAAANNGKLTIKKDSLDTGTEFTADLSTDITCNLGLAAVATSGSYADLSNTPAIPTVNDAIYSVKTDISGAETTVSDFTANQSTADSITFVQGSNITLTPDATNKKITIAATDTTYSVADSSTAGLVKSLTTGTTIGRDYNVEVNSDGTMKVNVPWTDNNDNTTYSFSQSGNTLTITPSTGSASTYTPNIPAVQSASSYLTVSGNGSTTGTSISTYVPVGTILMYAGTTAPDGWLLCNGVGIPVGTSATNYDTIACTIQNKVMSAGSLNYFTHSILANSGVHKFGDGHYICRGRNEWIKTCTINTNTVDVGEFTSDVNDAFLFSFSGSEYNGKTFGYEGVGFIPTINVCIRIPDLRQRFPLGALDNGTIGKQGTSTTIDGWSTSLGKTGGEDIHTLSYEEMPSHKHNFDSDSGSSTVESPHIEYKTEDNTGTAGDLLTNATGGDQPHNNIPPYLAINFMIKY